MSFDTVREYLRAFGAQDRPVLFSVSSATVELAAAALGVPPARIAKTLSFLTVQGCLILVTAGDARIDNGKFKRAFGEKARMLPPEMVEDRTGHPVGGVCPFALKAGATVYLDESMRRFDTVYPAAGTANSAVPVTCEELEAFSRAQGWTDVCKDWQSS